MGSFDRLAAVCSAAIMLGLPMAAFAGERTSWFQGDWYLTVGAAGFAAPSYEGAKDFLFRATPMISLGKVGPQARFNSRNDNISLSLFDTGVVRAGAVGKIVFPRDGDTSDDLKGLDPVRWGIEAGAFAEVYPADWLRVRAEVRHGIRAHDGVVADISADAFYDVTPTVRVSAARAFPSLRPIISTPITGSAPRRRLDRAFRPMPLTGD